MTQKYNGCCPNCGYQYPEMNLHRDLEWSPDGMFMWYPERCTSCGAQYLVEFMATAVIPYDEYDEEEA